jgi:uncharacterized membrane protein HdeD (DUF308 family)
MPTLIVKDGKPVRNKPDWPTYRGYLGIVLGAMLAFFLTARATGIAQVIFILIWIVFAGAIFQFTKYDRRRRIRKESNDH